MILGIMLLAGGLIGFAFGVSMKRRALGMGVAHTHTVGAHHGSVAVGGDNNAPISVTSHTTSPVTCRPGGSSLFWTVWNIASGLVSFVGLALMLWPLRL